MEKKRKTYDFTDDEIELMLRMLQHDSIYYPIVMVHGMPRNRHDAMRTIVFLRSLYAKGAIDHPEDPRMHIALTGLVASLAGVVAERPTPDAPARWMTPSEALRVQGTRPGGKVRRRTVNDTDLTRRYRGKFALENVVDHRREYRSENDNTFSDMPLTILGASEVWHTGLETSSCLCEICRNAPGDNEYCIRCDTIGGKKNRKRR
jgi:hypothetical protein